MDLSPKSSHQKDEGTSTEKKPTLSGPLLLLDLPNEVLIRILGLVDGVAFHESCPLVCKRLNDLTKKANPGFKIIQSLEGMVVGFWPNILFTYNREKQPYLESLELESLDPVDQNIKTVFLKDIVKHLRMEKPYVKSLCLELPSDEYRRSSIGMDRLMTILDGVQVLKIVGSSIQSPKARYEIGSLIEKGLSYLQVLDLSQFFCHMESDFHPFRRYKKEPINKSFARLFTRAPNLRIIRIHSTSHDVLDYLREQRKQKEMLVQVKYLYCQESPCSYSKQSDKDTFKVKISQVLANPHAGGTSYLQLHIY